MPESPEGLINRTFDIVELVAKRLPALHNLIVELLLLALAVLGAYGLLHGSP
jgi:hypothetical protein